MRLRVRQKLPGGIYALAIVGCCLPLIAGAASAVRIVCGFGRFLRTKRRGSSGASTGRFILDGTIDAGAADRLSGIIAAEGIDAASVYLNSRGGDLAAGVAIGTVIREAGFSTARGTRDDG